MDSFVNLYFSSHERSSAKNGKSNPQKGCKDPLAAILKILQFVADADVECASAGYNSEMLMTIARLLRGISTVTMPSRTFSIMHLPLSRDLLFRRYLPAVRICLVERVQKSQQPSGPASPPGGGVLVSSHCWVLPRHSGSFCASRPSFSRQLLIPSSRLLLPQHFPIDQWSSAGRGKYMNNGR